jgi:hypothetical protein
MADAGAMKISLSCGAAILGGSRLSRRLDSLESESAG